jgi:hypothetical protein
MESLMKASLTTAREGLRRWLAVHCLLDVEQAIVEVITPRSPQWVVFQVGCVGVDDLELLDDADFGEMRISKFNKKKLKKLIAAEQGVCC